MKKISSFILVLLIICGSVTGLISPLEKASAEDKLYENKQYTVPGGQLVGTVNEKIYYSTRTVNQYINPFDSPGYIVPDATCGVIAGSNLIARYNKDYPSLIPGHTAGKYLLGGLIWQWSSQSNFINNLFPTINTLMGGSSAGVTMAGYLNGLNSYVTGKGRNFTYSSLMNSNGTLNQSYKTALSSGKLLTIFLDGFNITDGPDQQTGYDNFLLEEYAGAHIMFAYGWLEISYYNSQNIMFRQDSFLKVEASLGSVSNRLLLISSNCSIDDLYITHVS